MKPDSALQETSPHLQGSAALASDPSVIVHISTTEVEPVLQHVESSHVEGAPVHEVPLPLFDPELQV